MDVMAETLGASNGSQVLDLNANGGNLYTPAYAIYENGNPVRVALFNFVSDSSGASDMNIGIAIGGGDTGQQVATPSEVKVKSVGLGFLLKFLIIERCFDRYLLASSVSQKGNYTWAGQSVLAASAVTVYPTVTTAEPTAAAANYTGAAAYNPTVLNPPAVPSALPTQFVIQLQNGGTPNLSLAQNGSLIGFSIEMSVVNQILGKNSTLLQVPFLNLMSTLTQRSGRVNIRVGGNTQETAQMVDSTPDGRILEKNISGASNPTQTPPLIYTPDLLYMMANVSALVNVHWFIGVPFLINDTNTRLEITERGYQILGDHLMGIQVGNEPDLYQRHQHYTTYGPYDYYYASLIAAEAIGPSNGTQVLDLGANSGNVYTPAYAFYENGNPVRVAIINYVSDPTGASNLNVQIAIGGSGIGQPNESPASVKVKYLLADSVSQKGNFTWAGQTFGDNFASDGRPQGDLNITTIQCDSATNLCSIPVPAPGFALVYLTDGALDEPGAAATQTFATSVQTKYRNTATIDQAVLATSNGGYGKALGSTSPGSANAAEMGKRLPGFVQMVTLVMGVV
ncbi:hypothetical protein H0H93_001259, partial [Arthromyces matolae]